MRWKPQKLHWVISAISFQLNCLPLFGKRQHDVRRQESLEAILEADFLWIVEVGGSLTSFLLSSSFWSLNIISSKNPVLKNEGKE